MARRVVRKRRLYKRIPAEYVAAYAQRLLEHIRRNFRNVYSFTREDCLHLPLIEFDDVAFGTRYRKVCVAIAYLIDHGELTQKKFPDLCLTERATFYRFEDTTVSGEYGPTIRRLVTAMPRNKPFMTMQVVQKWRTDPQLTMDSKRKAVRNAIRSLVREGVCRKLGEFEYMVGAE